MDKAGDVSISKNVYAKLSIMLEMYINYVILTKNSDLKKMADESGVLYSFLCTSAFLNDSCQIDGASGDKNN